MERGGMPVNAEKWQRGGLEGRLLARYRRRLLERVTPLRPRTVLDVGCGEGLLTQWLAAALPGARIVGLDGDAGLLREAAARVPGVDLREGDVYALPFTDASFDLVLALEVLEHLDRPAAALRELRRVAAGHVVVTVPHEPFFRAGNLLRGRYARRLGSTPGHVNTWSRRALQRLVAAELPGPRWFGLMPWQGVVAGVRR